MANPQLEDGYIKIANSIWENLIKIRIPGEARQVLDFIIRKTYGWNKASDLIAMVQISEATGLKRQYVYRSLQILQRMNLVIKIGSDGTNKGYKNITEWGFNKDYDTWIHEPKKDTTGTNNGSEECLGTNKGYDANQKRFQSEPLLGYTKDTSTKENNICATGTNNGSPYSYAYEEFWMAFPRKINKTGAWKCYKKTIASGVVDSQLLTAAINYSKYCISTKKDQEHILHPSTFLGPQKRYLDYLSDDNKTETSITNAQWGKGQKFETQEEYTNWIASMV